MSEGWQQQQQRQQEGGDYDDEDASRMFICDEEEESSGGGMGFPCSSSPSSAATAEVAENAASIASCTSSTPAAGGISSSELDAWIRDEPMDCMMLLPDIQLDGGTTHDSMPQVSQHDVQLHQPPVADDVDVATKFCRSSSSCSSTFPESDNQECLELSIPEDFLDDKQQGLTEERASQRSPFPDLKKIIVKKPIMDKAVERLGGGRKGAIRLWNIIQVWLKHQQASGDGQQSPVDGILQNVGFLGGMQLPFGDEVLGDGNAQCDQGYQPSRGGNSVVDDGDNLLYGNPFGGCQQAMLSASGAHAQYASFVDPISPSVNSQQKHMGAQLGEHFYTYAGLRTVVDRDGSSTGLADCARGPMSPAATTRAARKSRMARQRRHSHTTRSGGPSPASWSSLVPCPADTGARQAAREPQQPQHAHQCLPSYTCRDGKGRGCEKSVKFLLQKELKPSDVGNLGRIVLPKKEAEVHLPYLTLREGITMAMEDMLTTHTWHFRYRFWPNNKSRMYLLEGTGEFVKSHCLKEGDVLQIYRDCKYGKHMIYGKKIVRPEMTSISGGRAPAASKSEDDNVSGVSSISDSSKDAEHSGTPTFTVSSSQAGVELPSDSKLDSDGLDGFPSLELGDEFIEEIMGLVDAPEEPSSPESGKEDS